MVVKSGPLPGASSNARRWLPARRLTLSQRKKAWAYVFVAAPFIYFMLVNFSAMFNSFLFSFQDYMTLRADRSWVGLTNYQNVLRDPIFLRALQNTIVFALVRVPILTVLSLGIALLLRSIRRFKSFYRMLYFMPFVTSGVAIAWVFKFLYLPNFGLFTALFDALGVPRVYFLGDPRTALASIIAVTVWAGIGYYTIIFLAGLEDIPVEYYEAAMVDGANPWQRFRRITLPLLNRTIVLVVVLCMISSLQNFTYVRLMSKDGFGGPVNSTVTMSLLIYKEAFFSLNMGKASAIAVLFFIIVLIITLVQRRLLAREYD
ncbi:MAG: sugar ABC transporter permease [Anaerolineae bacterium]|nr:sugar ABC transporter permease [Anaerolineae bacterium]